MCGEERKKNPKIRPDHIFGLRRHLDNMMPKFRSLFFPFFACEYKNRENSTLSRSIYQGAIVCKVTCNSSSCGMLQMAVLLLDARLRVLRQWNQKWKLGKRDDELKRMAGFIPVLSSQAHRIIIGYVQYDLEANVEAGDRPYTLIQVQEYFRPMARQHQNEELDLHGEAPRDWGDWYDVHAQRDMLYLASMTTHIHTLYAYAEHAARDWFFTRPPMYGYLQYTCC